ncbi:MAG: hypothetical protein HKO68_07185 [Desulfobacterales bacterium]|nr:hypothetical protein [Desulfobacterales bacterium]
MIFHKGLRHAGVCIVLLLISFHASFSGAGDTEKVARISAQQVNLMLGKPDTVIIDVRQGRNWWRSSKKISTAVRVNPKKLDQWIGKYTKDQKLIFYCA